MTMQMPILAGRRVLVVEDEYLLAADLAQSLEDLGAEVVGPAPSIDAALGLVETALDAAVLDINLGEGPAYPVADALNALGVPFVFASGYDRMAVPPEYLDIPRYQKPVDHEELAQALSERIERLSDVSRDPQDESRVPAVP